MCRASSGPDVSRIKVELGIGIGMAPDFTRELGDGGSTGRSLYSQSARRTG